MENLTLSLALLALVLSGASLIWHFVTTLKPPQHSVSELEGRFDELAVVVERLSRASARERMQRVRAAAPEAPGGDQAAAHVPAPPTPRAALKAQILARMRAGGQ